MERNFLKFVAEGDYFKAKIKVNVDIIKDNRVVMKDSLIIPDKVKNLTDILPGQKLTNQSIFIIKEGEYTLRVTFTDLNALTSAKIEKKLKIRRFSDTKLQISDIEIASVIEGVEKEEIIFDKNGLRVLPNPQLYYGGKSNVLNFYVEIYNLAYNPDSENIPYTIRYAIIDPDGNLVKYLGKKQVEKNGKSSVLNGGIDISFLRTGTYYLKLMLFDPQKKETAETKKIFFVQNLRDIFPSGGEAGFTAKETVTNSIEEYKRMNEKELNEYFSPLKYIATKEEIEVFKNLDIDGKRSFLVEFWKKRDPDPKTPGNEYKAEFMSRLNEANRLFSTKRTKGWRTDRGRVMLRYGKPDQIERNPGSATGNAYEIWNYYEIQGGVIFVFVDKTGVKRYELVHSTCQGELYDPDWHRWLTKHY